MKSVITRQAAQNLFRPPDAEKGSNTDKLQDLRKRLQLRTRELRHTERQQRQLKRVGTLAGTP